ncbi:hypothetical protein COCCADRAFT_31608 [Bipolaris zeicola 26-R-13]|uniref:Uncharacterized protein n=1 Tax=Cochliobolus carbonum (strain 26-R-13) TaxID=930089 RepID=W6XV38_COCC2|nr:uncharacterized protein COCCADRAFT_31608 [Bipolaris zeicola 26-R-13]EUC26644.1 hypothetical protein COCCADRAFT_31608 [Bipolaris zeicola 26-R-13]
MADLRHHLTTRPGRGYRRQLPFLKLCPTCNNDFIDKEVFESRHGYRGELCNNRQPQRRKANAQMQWELLYRQVEAEMSKHTPKRNERESILPRSNARSAAPPVSNHTETDSPADRFIPHNQDVVISYLTPYQLIAKSKSDGRVPDTEPQRWARPTSFITHMVQRRKSDIFS